MHMLQQGPLAGIIARLGALSKPFPRDALRAGADYVRRHPGVLLTVARNAAGLKLTIPLDSLRWLVEHAPKSKKSPRDVALGAAAPALSVAMTSVLMGNAFRAGQGRNDGESGRFQQERDQADIDRLVIDHQHPPTQPSEGHGVDDPGA